MKKILFTIIGLLFFFSAGTALAASPVLPSIYQSGNWYLTDATGAIVSCPTGPPQSWEEFYNDVSISAPMSFSCVAPPWLDASNLNATFFGNGNQVGDRLRYEFWTGTSQGGTNMGHVEIVKLFSGYGTITATTTTHFTSIEISTTTQDFRLQGYISPNDENVNIIFNVSTPLYSQWDHGSFAATTTGFFDLSIPYQNFSTSTIDIFTFTGTLLTPSTDPFYATVPPTIYDTISTTTTSSGIGVTHIPTPNETITAVASNCNPFNSFFSISGCVSYLFFPDTQAAANNVAFLRDNILVKFPLGYFTRFYTILSGHSTTTIPAISYTWANDGGPLAGKTLAFNVDDYMVQAKGLTEEMVSNTDHKTVYDIFMPFINLFLAIVVFYNLIEDIMGVPLSGVQRGRAEGAKINDKGGVGNKSYGPNRGDFNQSKT